VIVLVHNGITVTSILNEALKPTKTFSIGLIVTETLKQVADKCSDNLVLWCHEKLIDSLDVNACTKIFHHERIFASYNPTNKEYLPEEIGFVERSFYVKINKQVSYPTWMMSSLVGGINTKVLNNLKPDLNFNNTFDYFLVSLAKRAMIEGLFCYSEPQLLKNYSEIKIETPKASKQVLFKFVKQHYKWVWVIFLAWCYAIYLKQTSVINFLGSLFYGRLNTNFNLEKIEIQSSKKLIDKKTIDVIIPTIGRKKFLYDVLKDLAKQTHLPTNVIIVEQNPKPNSVSELEYLNNEIWPFTIKHEFTHQPGVCNARNIALSKVESEWTFLADDDIRFDTSFFEASFKEIKKYGISVLNYLCLLPNQKQTFFKTHQTTIFGSGSSMVKSSALKNLKFNEAYEFGFGEDTAFGMQLRNEGEDVVFIPNIKITHLKAPFGGYRTKINQLWDNETIKPKPSPTIQLLHQTYFTERQLQGYKLLLFLKQFKAFGYKNTLKFKKTFAKQWEQSVFWSNRLKQNNNNA